MGYSAISAASAYSAWRGRSGVSFALSGGPPARTGALDQIGVGAKLLREGVRWFNVAVAHGIDASTRVHFGANLSF
jgi:hypothetical protein